MGLPLEVDKGQRGVVSGWLPCPLPIDRDAQVIGSAGEVGSFPLMDGMVRSETPVAGVGWFEVGVGTVRESDSNVQLDW